MNTDGSAPVAGQQLPRHVGTIMGGNGRLARQRGLPCAELYFSDVLWPDFGREHLMEALADYGRRERRFGLVTDPGGI